jgi:hypothetical protein
MTRNLKAFRLALVTAVVLGAIGAQGASAVVEHSFRSDYIQPVLTGANASYTTGGSKEVWTFTPGLTASCDATFEGKQQGTVYDAITVHPKYHNCTSSLGNASVHTDGCNYIFDSDTTQASGHSASSEHAAVTLECETSHWIEITSPGCNITIGDESSGSPVNQSLHGIRFTNLSNHSGKSALTFTGTVRTMHHVATSGSLCSLAGHPAGTYTNGSTDVSGVFTGYVTGVSTGSITAGTTWHHGPQTNISISTPT